MFELIVSDMYKFYFVPDNIPDLVRVGWGGGGRGL